LLEFGMVQGAVQGISATAGLLIVRHLDKPDYARYAIVSAMVSACNILADLGIGLGLQSIGGRVIENRDRFSHLVASALRLRRRFAAASLAACLPATAWMLWRNSTAPADIAVLCLLMVASVLPLLPSVVWLRVAQLDGAYRRIQMADLSVALLRLAMFASMTLSRLSVSLAIGANAIANWLQLRLIRRATTGLLSDATPTNEDDIREMMRLTRRTLPNAVFYCAQGQLTLLILSAFGMSTGVADLSALGRIAAIFSVLSVTFATVLAPRFIRCQDPRRLPTLYVGLVGGIAAVLAPLIVTAWVFPEPFLWLLGDQYRTLRSECGWVVTAGCVGQLGAAMFALNNGRAWIRVHSRAYIPVMIAAQVAVAAVVDLRDFHGVLMLNLVTMAAPIPLFVLDAFLGLRQARENTVQPHPR
jgi:O-antigen/teichoic acid export membrane protein